RLFEPVAQQPGSLSRRVTWTPCVETPRAERVELVARLGGSTSRWPLWVVPAATPPAASPVRGVDALDSSTLAALRDGARVLRGASGKKGSRRTHEQQFYRGAPFVPRHPFGARVPAQLLYDLQSFDLEQPRVLLWDALREEVDPLLLVWDTHDIKEVRAYAL